MKDPGDYLYRVPGQPVRHPGKVAFLFFLLTLLVLLSPQACPDELTGDVVVLSLAASADLASTHYALNQCGGRCREGNPFMQSDGGRIVLKAASIAATSWVCDRLRKRGHRNAAKVIRWGGAALWAGLAVHNMRQASKLSGGVR